MIKKTKRKGFKMKTLIIAILLLTTTISLSAKTTDMYQHARAVRIAKSAQKNVKNYSKKLFFATRAAKAGNPKAQFDLAIMYASGNGVKKDERVAFYWFHKSARAGNVNAMYYMGLSFEQGRGVRANAHLARYWFKQASKAGHPRAIYNLAKVEKFLNHRIRSGNHYSMR
jgi:TPR repeat protein